MPLVEVVYAGHVAKRFLVSLRDALPKIVATALHIERLVEGHLKPEDVEVRLRLSGDLDIRHYDVEILIQANYSLDRGSKIGLALEREIFPAVVKALSGQVSCMVFIQLGYGAFAEYRPRPPISGELELIQPSPPPAQQSPQLPTPFESPFEPSPAV